MCVCVSHSVMPDSLLFHALQPTRLLCPWDFAGKDTGLVCCFLLLETVNKEDLKSFISSLCLETTKASFPYSPSLDRCFCPHSISHPAPLSLTVLLQRQSLFPSHILTHFFLWKHQDPTNCWATIVWAMLEPIRKWYFNSKDKEEAAKGWK